MTTTNKFVFVFVFAQRVPIPERCGGRVELSWNLGNGRIPCSGTNVEWNNTSADKDPAIFGYLGCNSICTLGHLLSSCPKALDRYSFRHDSVLSHLLTTIMSNKKEEVTVYADLAGWRINGGTIPPDLVLTEQKPDLVIIDRSTIPTKVVLLELTVPWDSSENFKAAYERKTARYERLAGDLREKGYNTANLPLEIGCRGVLNARNSVVLETLCNLIRIPGRQKLKGALGRIALLGSYRIWLARNSQDWSGGDLIKAT